jgi:hypothetical protein
MKKRIPTSLDKKEGTQERRELILTKKEKYGNYSKNYK